MIFLDTSVIYALADEADPNHAAACAKFESALQSKEIFLIHSYILVESAALLQSRLGLQAAQWFLEDAQSFQVEWVDEGLHSEAVKELKRVGKRQVSLVDCTSFIVMRRKRVRKVLAFDPDFSNQGFWVQ